MGKIIAKCQKILQNSLQLAIKFYQLCISPFFGHCCRFYPSCSNYALQAIQKHGVCHGCFMALKRILNCHPWHTGGFDPVPERDTLC